MNTLIADRQKSIMGRAAEVALNAAGVVFALALFIPMLVIVFDGPRCDRS